MAYPSNVTPIPDSGNGRLFSESGPFVGVQKEDSRQKNVILDIIHNFVSKTIQLKRVSLSFNMTGKFKNEFAGLSISKSDDQNGIPFCKHDPDKNDIVIALTESGEIIPGIITMLGKRMAVETAVPIKLEERAFIFSEDGKFITSTYQANGSDYVRMIPRMAIASWVYFTCNDAIESDYIVNQMGDANFIIHNAKNGKKYIGKLSGQYAEIDTISHSLAINGLGSLLPNYVLIKVKGN